MPRNTQVFVSILAVIAALLFGINIGRSMNRPTSTVPAPTPQITPVPTIGYTSADTCGITFTYPDTLRSMESSFSGMILADSINPQNSIVVVCQNEIPRIALTPDKIETLRIQSTDGTSSVSAKLYHDASQKDGTPVDKFIFAHPRTGKDVFIAGFGETFQRLLSTVKFR